MELFQGIGLVKVSRIEEAIRRQGKRLLDRTFSPAEQGYCESKRMKFEHYAARLAAKEAVLKALKAGLKSGLPLNKIEVKHEATGKPFIELNSALRKAAALGSKDRIELSLAHEREYAAATVVIIKS